MSDKNKEQQELEDLFLQALIRNDGLKVPSRNFTASVMAKLPKKQLVIEESSKFIGKNLTILIFVMVAIINIVVLYFLWPYFSLLIPENSFVNIIIDSASVFVGEYANKIFNQSATVSLLVIIGFGIFVLLGREESQKLIGKFSKKLSV
jgi:hypothetical protein